MGSQAIHREGDSRICGATTVSVGQGGYYVNGQKAAVDGDPDSHGSGQLIAACNEVYINGKKVVIVTNSAQMDDLCIPIGAPHCNPLATTGVNNFQIGEGTAGSIPNLPENALLTSSGEPLLDSSGNYIGV